METTYAEATRRQTLRDQRWMCRNATTMAPRALFMLFLEAAGSARRRYGKPAARDFLRMAKEERVRSGY